MVKSRQGLETSTRQGWHTGGIALYGYRFVEHDHPNPHKAARGQRKRTLEPDPVRAPVVRRIYDMYLSGGTPMAAFDARPKAGPSGPGFLAGTHCRIRRDRIDPSGVITLRYNSRLHHIGLGRRHAGLRVLVLVADLDVRVLTEDGELLRELTLDPSRDYQRQAGA